MLCCDQTTNDVAGYKQEIQLAQANGIDGFALDTFYGRDPALPVGGELQSAVNMYEAAKELGTNFKLFMSPDLAASFTVQDIRNLVTFFANHPNQLKIDGKVALTTYSGEKATFGYSTPTDGWKAVLDALNQAGSPVYFIPNFSTQGNALSPSVDDVRALANQFPYADGFFYWGAGGIPATYPQALDSLGKAAWDRLFQWRSRIAPVRITSSIILLVASLCNSNGSKSSRRIFASS